MREGLQMRKKEGSDLRGCEPLCALEIVRMTKELEKEEELITSGKGRG